MCVTPLTRSSAAARARRCIFRSCPSSLSLARGALARRLASAARIAQRARASRRSKSYTTARPTSPKACRRRCDSAHAGRPGTSKSHDAVAAAVPVAAVGAAAAAALLSDDRCASPSLPAVPSPGPVTAASQRVARGFRAAAVTVVPAGVVAAARRSVFAFAETFRPTSASLEAQPTMSPAVTTEAPHKQRACGGRGRGRRVQLTTADGRVPTAARVQRRRAAAPTDRGAHTPSRGRAP